MIHIVTGSYSCLACMGMQFIEYQLNKGKILMSLANKQSLGYNA